MKTPGKLTFLFLGGAKRVAMARLLAEATHKEGLEPVFISYELHKDCAIASMATVVEGLRWSDPCLMEHLASVVDTYKVDVVVPFVDAAVPVATRLAIRCSDIFCPGCNESMQQTLFDKVEAAKLFDALDLPIPKTFDGQGNDKDWIAKPRFGSASRGIIFMNAEEVENFDNSKGEYLIQECFHNREEISVDCYVPCKCDTAPIISPRKRLEVMGGEAIKTLTVEDKEVASLSLKILKSLQLAGAVTLQFLRDLHSGRLMLMEINPRLGGGCTASALAGADIPRCIVREALGLEVPHYKAKAGLLVCRYLTDVVIS